MLDDGGGVGFLFRVTGPPSTVDPICHSTQWSDTGHLNLSAQYGSHFTRGYFSDY